MKIEDMKRIVERVTHIQKTQVSGELLLLLITSKNEKNS